MKELLGGGNAIGRRLRYSASPGEQAAEWHEIVGVVADRAPNPVNPAEVEARVLHPAAPGSLAGMRLAVRVGPRPERFGPRLREIAAEIDPTLRPHEVVPVADIALTSGGGSACCSRRSAFRQ